MSYYVFDIWVGFIWADRTGQDSAWVPVLLASEKSASSPQLICDKASRCKGEYRSVEEEGASGAGGLPEATTLYYISLLMLSGNTQI